MCVCLEQCQEPQQHSLMAWAISHGMFGSGHMKLKADHSKTLWCTYAPGIHKTEGPKNLICICLLKCHHVLIQPTHNTMLFSLSFICQSHFKFLSLSSRASISTSCSNFKVASKFQGFFSFSFSLSSFPF